MVTLRGFRVILSGIYSARLTLAGLTLALLLGLAGGVRAKSEDDIWGTPTNLSQSGAADQPLLVAGPDGGLQAFWWDRFDGLVTALFGGATWSRPMLAPITMTVGVENPQPDEGPTVEVQATHETPLIVGDGSGWVHALWLAAPDEETGVQALLYSAMPFGSTSWSEPETVAESAVAFDVAPAPSGGLMLIYVRTLHTDAAPAGLYARRNPGGGGRWGGATAVYPSIYFRLVTRADAYVRVADGGGTIHVVWEDPRLEEALYARSVNGGLTWSEPTSLGDPDQRPARPRLLTLPDGRILRLWEETLMSGCNLYQQQLLDPGRATDGWGDPERVFDGLNQCPEGERSWTQAGDLLWLWGEGSPGLALAAWDAEQAHWSEPRLLGFRFEDPETGQLVSLEDLHAAATGGSLVVIGADLASGEVWATQGQIDALELAFAPPSPWSEPERLSRQGSVAGWAAVALDTNGGVHLAWSEKGVEGAGSVTLLYAQRDASAGQWSRAVEVAGSDSGEELARQPALLVDGRGLVHLVWSGGSQGQILYSRAQIDRARSAVEWSPPQTLSHLEMTGSWPQIGIDETGRLHVVYAVPLNDGRGIYRVHSEDDGLSWSDPEVIFDAQAAGWAMVDHPALALAADGTLYVAWVRLSLAETGPAQGIYYIRVGGADTSGARMGETNITSEPRLLADAGHDWPRLALSRGEVHVIYTNSEGSVFHRRQRTSGETAGGGWEIPRKVFGVPQVSGTVGLAADGGGTLHLVGASADGIGLLYTTWDGEGWSSADSFVLGPGMEVGLGAAAATVHQGGHLAVALSVTAADEEEEAALALFFTARAIPTVDVSATPTPLPLPSATPEPAAGEPTPTVGVPTFTPDLMAGPMPTSTGVDPRLLGGGVAAVILVGALVTWPLWGRRR